MTRRQAYRLYEEELAARSATKSLELPADPAYPPKS